MKYYSAIKKKEIRDFPGGRVDKTPHSECMGPGFNPWSGNWIPYAATKTQHSQIIK